MGSSTDSLAPRSDREYMQLGVLPLSRFPAYMLVAIERAVRRQTPPPSRTGGPYGSIPSRGWFEWHLRRSNRDPRLGRRSIPEWMRSAVIRRDGYLCHLCGGRVSEDDVHIDHVLPLVHGGGTTLDNLRVSHSKCNLRKGARVA